VVEIGRCGHAMLDFDKFLNGFINFDGPSNPYLTHTKYFPINIILEDDKWSLAAYNFNLLISKTL
jgi:hypothetical protein